MISTLAVAQEAVHSSPQDLPPGWWLIPGTKTQIKAGGYVKFDFIHDFNPIGSPDFFDVSKIPTDGSKGESTHLNVKETRLYLDIKGPAKNGQIRGYIEGDFYGTGGALRLRHAFIEVNDKWLAGQTWSNFMDENIIPNTLDFEKPAAYAFARHPLVRYKHFVSKSSYVALAVEEPSASGQAPPDAGRFENPLPDLTARYRVTKSWGHIQLSAFAGKLVYRFNSGGTQSVTMFGGNLSGQFNLNQDKLIYQLVGGPGVGRYRGGLSAGLDENDELVTLSDLGFTLGYEHRWSPALSSLFLYNTGRVDNSEGQTGAALHGADYIATNLLWHFSEKAFAGVEYLWGLRQDVDGAEGDANRLQLSVRYSFN